MKKKLKSVTKQYTSMLAISLATSFCFTSAAHAEWFYGIGTGLSRMNVDGQQGFNTAVGPIKYDISLDPQDFKDLTKSAFGFGGYATDGVWLIQYSLAYLELESDESAYIPSLASTFKARINFKIKGAEATVSYPVYKSPSVVTMVDAGFRYTKHEFDNSFSLSGAVNAQQNTNFSHDWTDALLGVTVNVPFARQWTWNNRLNAGFGGSDRDYTVSTGVTWRFLKNWSSTLSYKYASIKFENASPGDSDWYLYDADEKTLGLVFLYNW